MTVRTIAALASIAVMTMSASGASAQATQDLPPSPSAAPKPSQDVAATDSDTPLPAQPEHLLGDWGGLRTAAQDAGIKLSLGWANEVAHNFDGGRGGKTAAAGQIAFAAETDLQKLTGVDAGKIIVKISQRYGRSLSLTASLDTLQQVQEIYGRGNVTRISELSYSKDFLDKRLNVKFGRMEPGDDFGSFSCKFQNLTFCYFTPDHIAGDNFFAYPVSMWAARAKVKITGDVTFKVGAYDINPELARPRGGFSFNTTDSTGTNYITELNWEPKLGSRQLRGIYKIGGWHSTARREDLFFDIDRQPLVLTGAAPLERHGYNGIYAQMQQQLTNQPGPGDRGLSVFVNFFQTDEYVVQNNRVINAGLFYSGFLDARPYDEIGFAAGQTRVSSRLRKGQQLLGDEAAVQHAEYPLELYYSVNFGSAVTLRPNLQYVVQPDGYKDRSNLVVAGLKTIVQF